MHAHQPSYATRINEPGHRISTLTYPGHPFPPDLCSVISKLPEGFAEVALSRSIAVEFISFLLKITELTGWISLPEYHRSITPQPGITMQRAIYDLQCFSALPLNPIEAQIVRAVLAFCLHLYNEMSFRIPLARPLRPLLEAFNGQSDLPRQPWLQRCLLWCAMVIASSWDTQIDASPERHVVLDKLATETREAKTWELTEGTMRKFLWYDGLADEWEVCWRATAFRNRRRRRGASQFESISQLLIESGPNSDAPSSDEQL